MALDSAQYTFFNPRDQVCPLPYHYSNYILKYYKTKAYANLMMTCKKFFAQNRILVAMKLNGLKTNLMDF